MKTRTLTLRQISQDLNLKERKICLLKLWFKTKILNRWEIRDFVVSDRKDAQLTKVGIFLFEKKRRKKQIFLNSYFINLRVRGYGAQEDIIALEHKVPEKLQELFNKFRREGYVRLTTHAKQNSSKARYLKRHLGFEYSKLLTSENRFFDKNARKDDILTISLQENV